MFLIGIIFQEDFSILKLFFAFFLLIFIFYGLGKIILNNFKVERNNNYFAFFIGFLFYQLLTFFSYSIIIVLNYNLDYLNYFSDIIDVVLIIYILISYRVWWFQSFNINKKEIFHFAFIYIFTFLFIYIFIILENNLSWFNNYEQDLNYLTINNIINNNSVTELFKPYNNNLDYYAIFQTNYYWIMILTKDLNIDLDLIVKYFLPAIYILLILFLIKGLIIDEKNLRSILLFLIFGIIIIFVFGYQDVISIKFYLLFNFLAIIIIFLRYVNNYYKDNGYLSFIIILTLSFYTTTYYAIVLTISIAFALIFYLIYTKENIFNIIYYFLLVLFIEAGFYFYAINIFYALIFIAFFGLIILLPFTFVLLIKNQKQIHKFEILVKENQKNATFILSLLLSLGIILALSISASNYFDNLTLLFNDPLFKETNNFDSKYLSIPLYIILFTLNLFIFLSFYYQNKDDKYKKFNDFFLFFALLFLILFNMFSIPIWVIFFDLPVPMFDDILLIYVFACLFFFANFLINYNFKQNDRINTYIKI
ncbi:hypothetical protein X271_00582 [Candidatus Hepatoplasma crinochetorum Av]|uniref:Uncharacterized protein n=1 Tax=Candidatus Hepatoplasma crinochetorum Av TaxID=1427984 RepID=W8GGD5_9MOLU|nr:hypothetical protein [Candidatus Hepatoplasma crinochetorum]AHK22668.1 hypothetical protein X271_00582 [Candidatus Hepatoplasma crinochetorum Av]